MKPLFKLKPELLVGPNIPRPLHGTAPRVVLGSKWWNITKKAAYASTDNRCLACGIHASAAKYRQWMEAHEVYEIDYVAGKMTYVETVPLCHLCHNYIHDGRLRWLLSIGKLHFGKFAQVVQHGDSVVSEAGLPPRLPYQTRDQAFVEGIISGSYAAWYDWRLVVDGKEYPPIKENTDHE